MIVFGVVVLWFAFSEVATHFYYTNREAALPRNTLPPSAQEVLDRAKAFASRGGAVVNQRDIGTAAFEMLRCKFGETLYWNEGGAPAALTILKWDDSSVIGGVEGMHNPGNCLAAAGWQVGASEALGLRAYCGTTADVTVWEVRRGDLEMRAFSAVIRRFSVPALERSNFRNSERLDAVLAGRRDAPVYIILAYLPASVDPTVVQSLFDQLMRAGFCPPDAPQA